MATLNVIASGSSGNCSCIEHEDRLVFVDIGVPRRRIDEALAGHARTGKDISLFLTHEHTDHVLGLVPFLNKYDAKVYASEGTAMKLEEKGIDTGNFFVLDPDVTYGFGTNFTVRPFAISHDSAQPFGYSFDCGGRVITFATDLGVASGAIIDRIRDANVLVLESNYEDDLLDGGSYPAYLKQRIRGNRGHLSNRAALEAVSRLAGGCLNTVLLAHVSEENNDYRLLDRYVEFMVNNYKIAAQALRQNQLIAGIAC